MQADIEGHLVLLELYGEPDTLYVSHGTEKQYIA